MSHQCAGYETVKDRPLSILLIPFPAPSHMMGMTTLGEELIRHGHNVTFCVAQIKTNFVAVGKEICSRTGMFFLHTVSGFELSSYKFDFLNIHLKIMITVKDIEGTSYNIKTSCRDTRWSKYEKLGYNHWRVLAVAIGWNNSKEVECTCNTLFQCN